MMSSQNVMLQPCPYKGLLISTKWTSRLHDKSAAEQKGIHSRSQAVGNRQEATSEAMDHSKTEVNKIDVGTEATAFVFTVYY